MLLGEHITEQAAGKLTGSGASREAAERLDGLHPVVAGDAFVDARSGMADA